MISQPRILVALIGLWLTGLPDAGRSLAASPDYPARPVKVIVPFAAGGGSDTFGRIIQQATEQSSLLPEPLVIINVPGAGGTIGSRRVKNARPDGYTLLLLHEGILTAKYAGKANYGPEAFNAIAGTGRVDQVVAVSEQSPFQNLPDLMDAAARRPDQVVFAANLGAPSHFAGLMLESEQPGATFRYMQSGGGAKRFAALQGGHVDASAFSIAEYLRFRAAGMRALAVFSESRQPDVPDVPTAKESGFDVISQNMHFWWAPRGTPRGRIARIADALEQAMATPSVRDQLTAMNMEPTFLEGGALAEELKTREQRLAKVVSRPTPSLPNLPAITLVLTVVLGGWTWVASRDQPDQSHPIRAGGEASRRWLAVAVIGTMCVYALVLQLEWLTFRAATFVFITAIGAVLVRRWRGIACSAGLAIVLSFGLHFLFTSVLVVDLP